MSSCPAAHVQFGADHSYDGPGMAEGAQVAVADFNCDGKADFVAGEDTLGGGKAAADVYLNHGDGTFAPAVTYADDVNTGGPAVRGCATVAAGDVDGDGFADFVCAYGGTDVYLNRGDGTFTVPPLDPSQTEIFPDDADGHTIRLADVNGDGRPDLVGDGYGTFGPRVALNTGSAPFFSAPSQIGGMSQSTWSRAVAIGDLTGDGLPDVVSTLSFHGVPDQVCILANQGSGSFSSAPACTALTSAGDGAADVAIADFDGDGKNDLVVAAEGGEADSFVFIASGAGKLGAPVKHSGACLSAYAVVTGDFNADGHADYALDCNADGSAAKVAVFYGNGDGTFASALSLAQPSNADAFGWMAAGDFTGQGLSGFVVSGTASVPFGTSVLVASCSP